MIYVDTFQVARTFARPPDQHILDYKGWKPFINKHSGKVTSYYLNFGKGEGAPRLTLAKNRNDLWNIRAEVSPGRCLFGSNLSFLTNGEFSYFLDSLSELVETNSGITFDAHTERVSRVDFTRDFQVDEQSVIPIIKKYGNFDLKKYSRICYDDTSVYFENSGKIKNKTYKLYSKYHERLSSGADAEEIEKSKGLIRLEISYRKNAVNQLAKSLKLKSHHVNDLLTADVSEKVIEQAMVKLNFDSLFNDDYKGIESLFVDSGQAGFSRLGYLYLKSKHGGNLADVKFINTSPKTLKRYEDACRNAGVLTLE